MNVAYLGPLKDYSGYGEANRHFVIALDTAGVNVLPQLVSYSHESSDFGQLGARIDALLERKGEYRVKILHTTPNVFKRHIEPGKYHIAHFFWETNRVPDDFIKGLKLVDEIWTGSQANVDALVSSGITDKPIHIFPQAVETNVTAQETYEINKFDGYLFYSIFEWTERKNPAGLLKAYWSAFQNNENVGLLIKTYYQNFQIENRRFIRHEIERIKADSGLEKFPPVFLYMDLMDRDQVARLHYTGDCYVSAHHGEGWGVPQVQAAVAGRPMISTNYGGCHEYFTDGKDALLTDFQFTAVKGMERSQDWYSQDQQWAEPNQMELTSMLKWAFANHDEMTKIGAAAQQNVVEKFNFSTVGKAMADRLTEIERDLDG